ncbi:hypothetical protein LOKVESSMR4R_01391 [Yoonia vestfoldensis]|uniref:Antifreeze glycopeptide polyprotein n=1 Tax=Yoonia vestfoldensis TaxID=245188 RepID=A0A1Y0EBC8_9RHOB|nr:hypothetical protein LOKVESSMR4R_01391 [Yoonia vestfoldensis]
MPISALSCFRPISQPPHRRWSALSRLTQTSAVLALVVLTTGPAVARDPLSSIDWLSQEAVSAANLAEAPVVQSALPPDIEVMPLDRLSKDPVGLLPSDVTGLPHNIWSASNEQDIVALIRGDRRDSLPAIVAFVKILMQARADPPLGAGPDGALFLARVDRLVELGAVEQAQALIELATPDTPDVFQRWFDLSLLTGTEDAACRAMNARPELAPTYAARIFCLARGGQWPVAVLSLNTHRVLSDITASEADILARFLDPELFEAAPPLPAPSQVTPLTFRLFEAFGEPLITRGLPLAFAHADLRGNNAWRAQLEAAERLARQGAVPENVLQKFYTARRPAASGGIWDRAAAIIRLDSAIEAGDPQEVARSLPAAWDAMKQARTEVAFAKLYSNALQAMDLRGEADDIANRVGLLSDDYRAVAARLADAQDPFDPFLIAIALGQPQDVAMISPRALAIQAAFDGAPAPVELQNLVANGKTGEAMLRAISLFNEGFAGEARSLTDALALFLLLELDDLARRAALELMILDRAT